MSDDNGLYVTCDKCGREAPEKDMKWGLFETRYCIDNPDCEYPSFLSKLWMRNNE